jgi:hypothetical protein
MPCSQGPHGTLIIIIIIIIIVVVVVVVVVVVKGCLRRPLKM